MQASIGIPVAAPALHSLLADGIVHAPTTVKGERVRLLQPITRERLFAHLIANGEDIGLCLLEPPKLSVGIPGHREDFLCNDNRHTVLPNRCEPTSIVQFAPLGNKKDSTDRPVPVQPIGECLKRRWHTDSAADRLGVTENYRYSQPSERVCCNAQYRT